MRKQSPSPYSIIGGLIFKSKDLFWRIPANSQIGPSAPHLPHTPLYSSLSSSSSLFRADAVVLHRHTETHTTWAHRHTLPRTHTSHTRAHVHAWCTDGRTDRQTDRQDTGHTTHARSHDNRTHYTRTLSRQPPTPYTHTSPTPCAHTAYERANQTNTRHCAHAQPRPRPHSAAAHHIHARGGAAGNATDTRGCTLHTARMCHVHVLSRRYSTPHQSTHMPSTAAATSRPAFTHPDSGPATRRGLEIKPAGGRTVLGATTGGPCPRSPGHAAPIASPPRSSSQLLCSCL